MVSIPQRTAAGRLGSSVNAKPHCADVVKRRLATSQTSGLCRAAGQGFGCLGRQFHERAVPKAHHGNVAGDVPPEWQPTNGRSQAVRLPAAFRFDTKEVLIRQDPKTGDVILSRKPTTWDGFFMALEGANVPQDFLSEAERVQGRHDRDPCASRPSPKASCFSAWPGVQMQQRFMRRYGNFCVGQTFCLGTRPRRRFTAPPEPPLNARVGC